MVQVRQYSAPVIEQRTNEFGQPIGADLGEWTPPSEPPLQRLVGLTVVIEPLSRATHADELFAAYSESPDSMWTYLSWGPFSNVKELGETIDGIVAVPDWQPQAVLVDGKAVGFFCYMRINPPLGSIEVGGVVFSSALQRTRASTEAQYLLMKNAFELGYCRYEWKCDSLNAPSRAAAQRLGFGFEGVFKKDRHYKGRRRDTAWYSITDDEWPAVQAAFEAWLDPSNFSSDGSQINALNTPNRLP